MDEHDLKLLEKAKYHDVPVLISLRCTMRQYLQDVVLLINRIDKCRCLVTGFDKYNNQREFCFSDIKDVYVKNAFGINLQKEEENHDPIYATSESKDNRRTITLCGIVNGNKVDVGYAICMPQDEFDWSLAKKISKGRAESGKEKNFVLSFQLHSGSGLNVRDQVHTLLKTQANYMAEHPEQFIAALDD